MTSLHIIATQVYIKSVQEKQEKIMLKKESFVESSIKFNLLLDFFERLFKVFLLFPQKFLTTFLRLVHFEKIEKIYSQ